MHLQSLPQLHFPLDSQLQVDDPSGMVGRICLNEVLVMDLWCEYACCSWTILLESKGEQRGAESFMTPWWRAKRGRAFYDASDFSYLRLVTLSGLGNNYLHLFSAEAW